MTFKDIIDYIRTANPIVLSAEQRDTLIEGIDRIEEYIEEAKKISLMEHNDTF